jgi:hypothetical protein
LTDVANKERRPFTGLKMSWRTSVTATKHGDEAGRDSPPASKKDLAEYGRQYGEPIKDTGNPGLKAPATLL